MEIKNYFLPIKRSQVFTQFSGLQISSLTRNFKGLRDYVFYRDYP